MKRPYCVALTGGVGSGKSLVTRLFSELGAEVVDTDVIARELTVSGGDAMAEIRSAFGPEFIAADGGLDRVRMREKVFGDAEARRQLETILHPLIRMRVAERLALSCAPYVMIVVLLLVETDSYDELIDRVLVVDCEPDQQVDRVARRDGVSVDSARAILTAQASRERRLARADDVIDNRGAPGDVAARVRILHQSYLAAALCN